MGKGRMGGEREKGCGVLRFWDASRERFKTRRVHREGLGYRFLLLVVVSGVTPNSNVLKEVGFLSGGERAAGEVSSFLLRPLVAKGAGEGETAGEGEFY